MDLKPLFVFPRWSNTVTLCVLLFLAVFPLYGAALVGYAFDPVTLNQNYQPVQPVPYSHKLHVGTLGIDCRYCHNTVENAGFAAIPPTETCMNCHRSILPKSEALKPIRDSFATGKPVEWRQVTTIPDYVYFNHAAHVNSGVSCVECHGPINTMEIVYQAKPMNMGWCLQCHRDPTSAIRPRGEVTHLDWQPGSEDAATLLTFAHAPDLKTRASAAGIKVDDNGTARPAEQIALDLAKQIEMNGGVKALKREVGSILKDQYHVNPNTDCITCHR
ncbi:MAG TPA: cytochrome c3 family protein [Phycisphaerae bacterium]|nr:cytochrome c3 family protein [Phycisphaerae bacterium]